MHSNANDSRNSNYLVYVFHSILVEEHLFIDAMTGFAAVESSHIDGGIYFSNPAIIWAMHV